MTELQLDLLFDISVSGTTISTDDVRDLTQPLWNLSENAERSNGDNRPPLVRFIWGKTWNIPGVIAAVAERLEYFTPGGVPRRSWLRLRMLRSGTSGAPVANNPPRVFRTPVSEPNAAPVDEPRVHEVVGGGVGEEGEPIAERLDEIAWRYYLDPAVWRGLAQFNNIDNPLRLWSTLKLRIP
jgi:hypothetical protein